MVKRTILLVLLAVPALAETPPLRMTMDVTGITATGAQWIVSGKVYDTTAQGSVGTDITTNCLVACETDMGDVDIYRIDGVLSATALHLSALVSYLPDGSNAVPRIGGPTFGQAAICASFTTNGIPLTAYYGGNGLSPYLKDALNAIAIKKLSTNTGGESGSAPTDLTWVAFINGREAETNYSVQVSGGSWSNGVSVLSGTGAVSFVSLGQRFISDLSCSWVGSGLTLTPQYLASTGWVTMAGSKIFESNISTSRFLVADLGIPTMDEATNSMTISNIYIGSWGYAPSVATTNDFRGMIVRVDTGIGPDDAVSVSQLGGVVSNAMGTVSPATWAEHPAISVVDCDGHPLRLDANYSFSVSNDVLSFTFQDRPIFRIVGGGTANPTISTFTMATGTVSLSVEAMRGWRPIPQWSASLTTPSWSPVASFASSYPELVKGRHVLTFPAVTNNPAFYRVVATNEAGSEVVAQFGAPVTAPSFTGVHVLTNGTMKYDLYIDAAGDLCTRRTE